MSTIKFFDSNGMVIPNLTSFPRTMSPEARSRTADMVEEEMKRVGITRALVRNSRATSLYPTFGNHELIQHISGKPGLYPAWYLLPPLPAEMGSTSSLLDEMEQNNVRAVWLAPGPGSLGEKLSGAGMAYTLDEWCIGQLLSTLEDKGFPIFIEGFGNTWEALNQLCQNHPNLPVVIPLTNKWARVTYSLLKKHENLYISTAGINDHLGIEELVDLIGPERIIFGADPGFPAGQVNQLLYANIDESDIRRIASGNLERLLGEGVDEEIPSPEREIEISEIEKKARSGISLKEVKIIDCHVHLSQWAGIYIADNSEKALLSTMDRVGVDKVCANHFYAACGDMRKGDEEIFKLASKYPDRFEGVGYIDPNYSPEIMGEEIKRCVEEFRFRMFKIHPAYHRHNVPILDPRYKPVWEGAKKYGYIILTHTTWGYKEGKYPFYNPEPEEMDELARKYPEIVLLMGHSGNNYPGFLGSIEVAKHHSNLYLDTSGFGFTGVERVKMAVKEVGADRILFGSDWTYLNQAWGMGFILYAKISDEDKRKILGGNISRLLKQAEERYKSYKKGKAKSV